jgi:hypothetical protein
MEPLTPVESTPTGTTVLRVYLWPPTHSASANIAGWSATLEVARLGGPHARVSTPSCGGSLGGREPVR